MHHMYICFSTQHANQPAVTKSKLTPPSLTECMCAMIRQDDQVATSQRLYCNTPIHDSIKAASTSLSAVHMHEILVAGLMQSNMYASRPNP